MFVHGIPFQYVPEHYPVLRAIPKTADDSEARRRDAQHLIEQFGFEPVHFLHVSSDYSFLTCCAECLYFGDTLIVFHALPYPRLQLSRHEWGVCAIDLRDAHFVLSRHSEARAWFAAQLPQVPFLSITREDFIVNRSL